MVGVWEVLSVYIFLRVFDCYLRYRTWKEAFVDFTTVRENSSRDFGACDLEKAIQIYTGSQVRYNEEAIGGIMRSCQKKNPHLPI
jgi:hypothetical protein